VQQHHAPMVSLCSDGCAGLGGGRERALLGVGRGGSRKRRFGGERGHGCCWERMLVKTNVTSFTLLCRYLVLTKSLSHWTWDNAWDDAWSGQSVPGQTGTVPTVQIPSWDLPPQPQFAVYLWLRDAHHLPANHLLSQLGRPSLSHRARRACLLFAKSCLPACLPYRSLPRPPSHPAGEDPYYWLCSVLLPRPGSPCMMILCVPLVGGTRIMLIHPSPFMHLTSPPPTTVWTIDHH
jgi:hypothetical protein